MRSFSYSFIFNGSFINPIIYLSISQKYRMNFPYEIENSYLFRGIHLMEEVNPPTHRISMNSIAPQSNHRPPKKTIEINNLIYQNTD